MCRNIVATRVSVRPEVCIKAEIFEIDVPVLRILFRLRYQVLRYMRVLQNLHSSPPFRPNEGSAYVDTDTERCASLELVTRLCEVYSNSLYITDIHLGPAIARIIA